MPEAQEQPQQPQEDFRGIPARAEVEQVAESLMQRKPVDYKEIWGDSPAIFFGERHTELADKDEIINNLLAFKDQGLTHVAMEMFREEHQPVIDRYFRGEATREEIAEVLKGWDKGEGIVDKYIEMVDAVKSAGLKLLAVDLYTQDSSYFSGEFFKKRNANWARIINSALRSTPNGRALVFGGTSHSMYNMVHDSANEILASTGIPSVVVSFAGANKVEHTWSLQDRVAKAADNLGIAEERFQIRLNAGDVTRPGDYIIHLPQREQTVQK